MNTEFREGVGVGLVIACVILSVVLSFVVIYKAGVSHGKEQIQTESDASIEKYRKNLIELIESSCAEQLEATLP